MTSPMQADLAPESTTVQGDEPSASSTTLAPSAAVPSAPAPISAAVKSVAKRVARTPVKKTTTPAKPAARIAVKVAVKPIARTVRPKAAVTSTVNTTLVKVAPKATIAPAAKPAQVKLLKAKKPKLVRDSFTIPKLEYLRLEELKHRGVKLGTSVKKSELIRAGIMALAAMSDAQFLKATQAVPAIKTGRPAKD